NSRFVPVALGVRHAIRVWPRRGRWLYVLAHVTVYPAYVRQDVIMMSFLDEIPGTFWPIGYHLVRYAVL
ncbi:MAG TPA: hypothetical protein VFX24_14235, partial [Ktedonobacterales bacterium]|nr:hypothetical protein [Ktedonobacterales bacterium]